MNRRFITRRIPGFVWVQFILTPKWRVGCWWAYSQIVRTYALGPTRVVVMRERA